MLNRLKKITPFQFLVGLHVAILLITVFFLLKQEGHPRAEKEKIVVIPIEGVISLTEGSLSGGQTVDKIVNTLHKIKDNKDVKAVVLRINSPGGSVGAVQEIYRALKKVKKEGKVIVSSFGDISASGGYYLACAGDHIMTNPGTITGSIGVVMQIPNFQGLLQKVGVSFEVIKSGAYKDTGSPFRKMSEREKALFKEVILDAYDQFYVAVKEGRKLSDPVLKTLADGRIFSGRLALKHKLVDSLGGIKDAIEKAKELTGLKDKEPTIIYKKEKGSLERLLRLFSKSPLDSLKAFSPDEFQLLYQLK